MSLFVITINNQSPALEKKFQEVERIKRFAESALQTFAAAGGVQTSGTIFDSGGATTVGSWVYVPQAVS
jgi:hypothetical protein